MKGQYFVTPPSGANPEVPSGLTPVYEHKGGMKPELVGYFPINNLRNGKLPESRPYFPEREYAKAEVNPQSNGKELLYHSGVPEELIFCPKEEHRGGLDPGDISNALMDMITRAGENSKERTLFMNMLKKTRLAIFSYWGIYNLQGVYEKYVDLVNSSFPPKDFEILGNGGVAAKLPNVELPVANGNPPTPGDSLEKRIERVPVEAH